MREVYHPQFQNQKDAIRKYIANFENDGIMFADGNRNKIKLFPLDGVTANVKSFKIPNLLNQIVYKFFRKSKARRSYEFANILLQNGIGTPQPIGYFENHDFVFRDSYYISVQLNADLTFRDLTNNLNYPDQETILRQFIHFFFNLHEKGIEFLDNTPGNTLITKIGNQKYEFFLVDLNRMQFHQSMNFDKRIINLSKLTTHQKQIEIMSDEYAKLYGMPYDEVLTKMVKYTQNFQTRFIRKRKLKKHLKFWR